MPQNFTSTIAEVVSEELVTLAQITAAVALYCDRIEHAEQADRGSLAIAGTRLLQSAARIAEAAHVDIVERYAARLEMIEGTSVLKTADSPAGAHGARRAGTWRDLQTVQADHDRFFHPDVWGLPRTNQVRHYVFHLAKITGALADVQSNSHAWKDFENRRLPDLLLFGLKLATLTGQRLPDDALPAWQNQGESREARLASS